MLRGLESLPGRSDRKRPGSETIEFALLAGVLVVFFLTIFSFELIGMFRTAVVLSAWRIERVQSIYGDALGPTEQVVKAGDDWWKLVDISKVPFGEFVKHQIESSFAVSLSWPDRANHNYDIDYQRRGEQDNGFSVNILNKLTGIEHETLHWQEPGQPTPVAEHPQ